MKLYTEEQLRNSMLSMKTYIQKYNESVIDSIIEKHIKALGEFELPSDEEIWNEGKLVFSEKGKTIYTHYNTVPSWSDGALWLRDKIQGDNK